MRPLILGILVVLLARGAQAAPAFTVNNNGDGGDAVINGVCEATAGQGDCTLRAAIDEANATSNTTINFSGPMTIATSGYTITSWMRIHGIVDGSTPPVPQVVISGGGFTVTSAITVLIEKLRIVGATIGIDLQTTGHDIENNFIGSVVPGDGGNSVDGIRTVGGSNIDTNYVSGNGVYGIRCNGAVADGLRGNVVGLRNDGMTASANGLGGILVNEPNVHIERDLSGRRSVISGNSGPGITVTAAGTGFKILDSFVGTDITGSGAVPNMLAGILINGDDAVIGQDPIPSFNVISGNKGAGIVVANADGAKITGCRIGVNAAGTAAVPNEGDGIAVQSSTNTSIGGGQSNLISGNQGNGISVTGSGSADTTFSGNVIGLNPSQTGTLGNLNNGIFIGDLTTRTTFAGPLVTVIGGNGRGILIQNSTDNVVTAVIGGFPGSPPLGNVQEGVLVTGIDSTGNQIKDSEIANNLYGVVVRDAVGVNIQNNRIYDNASLSIDLMDGQFGGPDGNDALDADAGANLHQNFPILSCAGSSGGSTTIVGSLNSAPLTTYRAELFGHSACGDQGRGQSTARYGSVNVTTDASGAATFSMTVPFTLTGFLSATATDPNNNTSEFSPCLQVVADTVSANVFSAWNEDAGMATVVVTRGANPNPASVQYTTVDGTATAGQDYMTATGTLNFAACETQKLITIPIVNDAIDEPSEQFTLHLFNATGTTIGNADSTIQIDDDDALPVIALSLTGSPMAENGGQATVTATASHPSSQPITVNLAFSGSASPADYSRSGSSITIPPLSTSGSITLTATDDADVDPGEMVTVDVASVVNGAESGEQSVTATIADDDEVAVAPVPALSGWALLLLAAMVAAAGAIALRR